VLAAWLLSANHTTAPSDEVNMFFDFLAEAIFVSALFWICYLALEPYVRRTWPKRIVGWSRLLTGRWRDALVGRDVLLGGVFFLALMIVNSAQIFLLQALSIPDEAPAMITADTLNGGAPVVAAMINTVINGVFNSMFFLLVMLLLRLLFRRQKLAVAAYLLLFVLFAAFTGPSGSKWLAAATGLVSGTLWITVLLRFGLLVFVVGFTFRLLVFSLPMTLDSSAWYSGTSYVTMGAVMAVMLFGLWASRVGDAPLSTREPGDG